MTATSNNFEITGCIRKIFDIEQKMASFKVREFVIEVPDQYPQMVKFQCKNDRCDMLEQYAEGEEIEVSFNLSGREWQGKFFTTLEAWKIKRTGAKVQMNIVDGDSEQETTYEQLVSQQKASVDIFAQLDAVKTSDSDPFETVGEDDLPF